MITKQLILSDYRKLKKLALFLFSKKKYIQCIKVVKTLANFMYNFNIIYCDDVIEDILLKLASKYMQQKDLIPDQNTVLFYDFWALPTRGLTTIYIKGLLANNYRIIFVTYHRNKNTMKELSDIIKFDKSNSIIFIDEKKSFVENLQYLDKVNHVYKPSTAFLHTMPDDVLGTVFFAGISAKRYLINLTDHAFWIGKECVDYIIEFRNYGFTVSCNERNLKPERLITLPYYPVIIEQDSTEAKNFCRGKFIMSGGALYKLDGSYIFFDIVKYILLKYEDFSFLFIGGGNSSRIKEFIRSNNFEKRFFHMQERKDFECYINEAYFYLCTYPINGALMTQYALIDGVIPLSLNLDKKDVCSDNDINSILLDNDKNPILSYDSVSKLKSEIDKLIDDLQYKKQREKEIKGLVITEKVFNKQLKNCIEINETKYKSKLVKLNLDTFSKVYVDAENEQKHNYNLFFVKSKSIYIFLHFPIYIIKGLVDYISKRLKFRV